MVYTFICHLIAELKSKHQYLNKVHHFSNGCSAQYNNCFNHFNNFGINAELNFFATSHGKNACNGIGGSIKRSISKASLQRPLDKQILTPEEAFKYCTENLSDRIPFFCCRN